MPRQAHTTTSTKLFGMIVHVHGAVVGGEAFAEQLLAVVAGVPRMLLWLGSCDGAEVK